MYLNFYQIFYKIKDYLIQYKNIILKILISLGIFLLALFVVIFIYMLIVYFQFLENRDSIFIKINEFSEALKQTNETNIILGVGEEEDKEASYILDKFGNIIAKYSPEKHKLIKLEYLPFFLSRGFLLIEDNRFYNHHGINFVRLSFGIIRNIFTFGHSPGGSTISQQLAKILFTKQKKTIKRKVYELYCTFELEKRFKKNEILQIYLNSIYLGHGVYGIENASQFYFGKDASELTIAEAGLLIGMNRAPEYFSPIKYKDNAKRIQRVVLNRFIQAGYLTKEDSEMELKRFWARFNQYGVESNQSFWKTEINRSGYVTEYLRQILEKEFSYEKITQGGLTVETTIDLNRQTLAENVVKEQLKYIRKKIGEKIKKLKESGANIETEVEEADNVEASFASIDYKNGEILALVGGSGYSFANQFNRAIYGFRPIGSAVKPFIYGVALSDGKIGDMSINPFTKFKDEIKTYIDNGKIYKPQNYHPNHVYGNIVTLYDALKRSLNTISVAVFSQMDKKEVADFIRNACFMYSDEDRKRVPEVLSLALGTCELSSLELATGYSVFCRGGNNIYPIIIKKIYDSKGNVYYDYKRENNPILNDLYPLEYRESKELIRPEASYEVAQMMKGVFEKGGTGAWAAYITSLTIPAYAKSGTTQDFKDGWFAGFTDNEASATWVGLDNNKPFYLPAESTAALIWCDYNQKVSTDITKPIPRPKNMKLLSICVETGLIATDKCPEVKEFYFWNDGPIPEKCYLHQGDIKLEPEE